MEIGDLGRVNDIYNQAVKKQFQTADTEPASLMERERWFKEHQSLGYPVFVYEQYGQIVGWISLSPYRNGRKALRYSAEVSYYIDSDQQGKGIGSQLMEFILVEAPKYGYKILFAILLAPNIPSIRLLEKFGFCLWGTLPRIADFDGIECDHLYYGKRIVD